MFNFKKGLSFSVLLIFLISCGNEYQQPEFEYAIHNPAPVGSQYPNLHVDNTGLITMSWIARIEEELHAVEATTYNNGQWTRPRTVRTGVDFFVNWADFPSAVSYDGEIMAGHWLKKIPGGPYAYDVNLAFPTGPLRWSDPITPHTDGTATEHGFVSMQPLSEDRVLAIWLDGRHTEHRGHGDYEDMDQAMTLRSAEINSDGTVSRSLQIDGTVCDCCQTDLVLTDDGRALAVYRNRTEDEIRDISIVSYDIEAGEWSEPRVVHNDGWQISGCPVNGPRIVVHGETVAVAWFTGADESSRVLMARSTDGGETFADPVEIATEYTVGRTDLVIGDDGAVYVSWLERDDEFGYIMLRNVSPNGEISNPIQIGKTGISRRSGFPRMARTDEGIFIAWTQTDPFIRIRTAVYRF